ncbi:hypothetical protein RJ639_029579 [Escallonia herrerae]|uniref:Uncharacterized protein n=1 Tax=Escallonia herrerae TaxID=1293975 RepID=A0AA88X9Q5_9ASTE|nr:hypothetical protein RJ639_029579 [Escallonia herrerae]
MAISYKGKLYALYFLLICNTHICRVLADSDSANSDEHDPALTVSSLQQIQLEKLEELVKNLTELVSRLDSRVSEIAKVGPLDDKKLCVEEPLKKIEKRKRNNDGFVEKIEDEGLENDAGDGGRVGAVSITKHSLFWSERFQFVSAVKLDSNATCFNVFPYRDYEGLSKYFALGDDQGRVYVFSRYGDVLLEFFTSNSPVTAMLSYMSVFKNESIVITGQGSGVILVHRVWEVSNGEDSSSLRMATVGKFAIPENGEDGSPITILEVHHVGRARYILSTDTSGKIRVFRENGTVYGLAVPTSRPLAFLKQRLLFLTETGAGSLDLRTMRIRESDCEGLNHSVVRNYVFDATERSKAYGFTSEGDLIHVFLLGDIMNFKCRIRSKKKFDMDGPLAFQAIKGYLLVVNPEKVFVYNVSSQHYVRVGGPRLLFSAGLDEIVASFLNYQALDLDAQKRGVIPLIASDREKMVILSLGNGYVGMYRSNLPISKGEFNTMLWSSPVLFFILFLFGAWHFFANKKEALTSWGPDDPFSSTSANNGAPLASSSGDRSFTDSSSRNADIMDQRGGGLRGPTRRYASPSRYPGGSATPFRPTPADINPRPTPVDPNFRTASELKYRGPNLESSDRTTEPVTHGRKSSSLTSSSPLDTIKPQVKAAGRSSRRLGSCPGSHGRVLLIVRKYEKYHFSYTGNHNGMPDLGKAKTLHLRILTTMISTT